MHRLYPVTGLLALVLPGFAGDVVGHALISKRLTKKAISPIVYNLRGATPSPSSYPETERSSELDRLVIILEGGTARSKSPETVVIDQRNMRFDPDLVVVPVGSTAQFPNSDLFFTTSFRFPRLNRLISAFIRKAKAAP